MTPVKKQQEILFYTGTGFARAELKPTNDSTERSFVSKSEQLENAFWNGMLFEILPELEEKNTDREKMFMWRISNYGTFMSISLGTIPDPIDKYFSVDPYRFNQTLLNN